MAKSLVLSMAVASLLFATSASATTVVNTDLNVAGITPLAGPTNDSNVGLPNSFFLNADDGFVDCNCRSPWEGTIYNGTGFFNSVEANGFAEYVYETTQTGLNLIWGSPDSYNLLTLYSGDSFVYSIAGNDAQIIAALAAAFVTDTAFIPGQRWVNVFISNLSFNRIVFEFFAQDAFEFSFDGQNDVTPQVPLPAGLLLLLSGLTGLGFLGRSRAKAS